MNRLTSVFLLIVSLVQLKDAVASDVECEDQPGLVYNPCGAGGHYTPGGPKPPANYTLLSCCTPHTHIGPEVGNYEFPDGPMDLVILCAKIDEGKTMLIRNFLCAPDETKKMATLSSDAVFPMTIRINGPRFRTFGGNSITFMVTNNAGGVCTCPTQCAEGWVKNGDYCYKVSDTADDFHAVDSQCGNMHPGAHLVSLHSAAESDWVVNNVPNRPNDYYIGLWDVKLGEEATRGWEWTDCSPVDHEDWTANQPDDWQGREDCIHQFSGNAWKWNDLFCTSSRKGICKYFLPPP